MSKRTGHPVFDRCCRLQPSHSPVLTAVQLLAMLNRFTIRAIFDMIFLVALFAVIWALGLLFVAGLHLNDIRVVLNNVAPGAELSMLPGRPTWAHKAAAIASIAWLEALVLAAVSLTIGRMFRLEHQASFLISRCDPACLTEAGRLHLANAARHENFALAWVIVGLAGIIMVFSLS